MPPNIQAEWESDKPTARYCYIDTIAMFFRKYPRGVGLVKKLQGDLLVKLDECFDRYGEVCGFYLLVQRPTRSCFAALHKMQVEQSGTLSRYDVAFDTICEWPQERQERLVRQIVVIRRPVGSMKDIEETVSFTNRQERTEQGKKRTRRELNLYPDRECKVTGEGGCVHVELRHQGADSVRRSGYPSIGDLPSLNPRHLFAKNIRLAEFDMEGFIQRAIRRHVKADRAKYRGRVCSPFLDRYRASAHRRVRSIIERATQMRVQRFRDLFKVKVEWVGLDVLDIPETLTFDDNHKHHTPSSNYPNDINDTTLLTNDRSLTGSQKQSCEGIEPMTNEVIAQNKRHLAG